MSRSTYVYVVTDETRTVVAVFTVKHELERWLTRRTGWLLEVTRHRDADSAVPPVGLNPVTLEPAL